MKRLLLVILLFILKTLITGLLLKFWVLKGMWPGSISRIFC
ncbi:hypothetical protein Gotur_019834 [Gossypium turneri]